jgi:hypothetical protein
MHKLRCLHLSAAVLAFAALVGMEPEAPNWKARSSTRRARSGRMPNRHRRPKPCRSSYPAAHRIGHQRVKPTARHTTISDAPADLGTWSTAVDRKRTLVVSKGLQIGRSDYAAAAVLLACRVCPPMLFRKPEFLREAKRRCCCLEGRKGVVVPKKRRSERCPLRSGAGRARNYGKEPAVPITSTSRGGNNE